MRRCNLPHLSDGDTLTTRDVNGWPSRNAIARTVYDPCLQNAIGTPTGCWYQYGLRLRDDFLTCDAHRERREISRDAVLFYTNCGLHVFRALHRSLTRRTGCIREGLGENEEMIDEDGTRGSHKGEQLNPTFRKQLPPHKEPYHPKTEHRQPAIPP